MHSPTPAASIQHAASLVGRENDERRMCVMRTISSFQYFAVISLHVTADVIQLAAPRAVCAASRQADRQVFVYPPVRLSEQMNAHVIER